MSGNTSLYFAYVYTEFRGYFIGETLASASPEGLDEAANSLHSISFQEGQVSPKCIMSASNSVMPSAGAKIATPQLVRISSGVSTGLLIKKVQPQYPSNALHPAVFRARSCCKRGLTRREM
jgi:hypothetical protein